MEQILKLKGNLAEKSQSLKNTKIKLDRAQEAIKKLTIGVVKLDPVLSLGKFSRDKNGLGYEEQSRIGKKGQLYL